MARKERNSVDYFPHEVSHGKKMFYLRDKYKNDGYAVWFMLLEQLGKSDYHYLDLKDNIQLMYLSAEFKVSEELLLEIIDTLVKFNEFDRDLWLSEKILYNQKFIDNISDAYKKRNNECVDINSLRNLLMSIGRIKPLKSIPKQPKINLKGVDNTQTILEETKEKKTIINKTLLSEINISDIEEEEIIYFEIAKAYQQLFIKNLKEKNAPAAAQENAKYKAYVDPIRLMMTKDEVTKEQLTKVFKYLGSPQGEFWKSNILSTTKLREKFTQLLLKSQENGKSGQTNNNQGASDEFRAKTAQRLGIIQS